MAPDDLTLTLSYYDERGQIRQFRAPGDSVTVGGDSSCDLTISGLAEASCRIYLAEGGYYAYDLGGGIAVDGQPGSDYLQDGSTLTLGGWLSIRVSIQSETPLDGHPGGRREEPRVAAGARSHHPAAALLLSIVPGGGQAYNGQVVKAVAFLMTSPLVLTWIWSLVDARSVAGRIVASGGLSGRGGLPWFILHLWLVVNVALLVLIVLTLAGVLT